MRKVHRGVARRKDKKGRVKFFARIVWTLPDGTTRSKEKAATSKTHARTLADQLAGQFNQHGPETIEAEKMTFEALAEAYKKARVIEAVYDGEIKVAGMRAKVNAEQEVKTLVKYWRASLIQKITHADLEAFKLHRLRTPTVKGTQRKMSSVNHDLRRMRAMLNFAKRKRWLTSNPFNEGEPLISEAAEIPRDRGEQPGELARILAACTGRRAHMKAFILCLVDTALRVSEARQLTRGAIDLEKMLITAKASTTKTNRRRYVPISERLAAELRPLIEAAADGEPIFGDFKSNKRAWKSICEEAGVTDLQLRDFRHWGATQIASALAAAGLPWQHGMATTGHTQVKTYLRYLNKDEITAKQTGDALRLHRESQSGADEFAEAESPLVH
ncbi:MAG: tyrosine-type recombinase/integrase [Blastocatellales bacterium]